MKTRYIAYCLPIIFTGCALHAPPVQVDAKAPAKWYAPTAVLSAHNAPDNKIAEELPHHAKLTDLSHWWQQQHDPLLVELIQAAQAVSPTVATALSRIEQSRATRVSAEAALLPKLDAAISATRSNQQAPLPLGTTTQAQLQPSWEVDLFGGNRAASAAALARLQGAQASWHDARVAVAAEVAKTYYDLRTCNKLADVTQADASSRGETARLSTLSTQAGFQAPAVDALAQASAAEGRGRATQQRALCELDIKALVALTAIEEPALRAKISAAPLPQVPPMIALDSVPAQTLTQRPDVFVAEREVAAASAEVGNAEAQRYPRLTLSGSVGVARFHSQGVNTDLNTWSIGPIQLTLPLFDGGARAANVDAAKARYQEAVASYRGTVRQAVKEVEQALVNLQSIADRSDDAQIALQGYQNAFKGSQAQYQNGLASLTDLEEARRRQLAAEINAVTLENDRMSAWIDLYRAVGGGWTNPDRAQQQAKAQESTQAGQ